MIKLTNKTGNKILVNPKKVDMITPNENPLKITAHCKTKIYFHGGVGWAFVEESIEDIELLLKEVIRA